MQMQNDIATTGIQELSMDEIELVMGGGSDKKKPKKKKEKFEKPKKISGGWRGAIIGGIVEFVVDKIINQPDDDDKSGTSDPAPASKVGDSYVL